MKKTAKLLSVALIFCILFSIMIPMQASALELDASGKINSSITWSFEYVNGVGTLTISGKGRIPDYSFGDAPWYDLYYKYYNTKLVDLITNVVIKSGITRIGDSLFYRHEALKSVSIPSSVISIGERAFYYCKNLTTIKIPSGVKEIEYRAFNDCNLLETVYIPKTVTSFGSNIFSETSINKVYYSGTKSQWKKINGLDGNKDLNYAQIICTGVNLKDMTCTLSNKSSGIGVSWKKASGAKGYYVYRKTGSGSYSKIATIKKSSTVSYLDKKVSAGKKYTYVVKSYSGSNLSKGKSKAIYRLNKTSISNVKNSSKGTVKVSWKKSNYSSGYQILCYLGSTKKATVTIKSSKTFSGKVTKLKKGKTYKIYVRSYKKISGKYYYSARSDYKSIKIRK